MPLIATYSYLVWSLGLFAMFVVAYVLKPAHRRVALASAILSAPYSFLAVVFVPLYWEPVQIFRLLVGPEDLIFSFANGGMVWILAATYYAVPDSLWGRTFRVRCAWITVSFLAAWFLLCLAGLPLMWAALAVGICLWCFLIWRDPAALTVSLKCGAVFAAGYTLWLAAILHVNPGFVQSWAPDGLVGATILAVPLEEILWAVEFGAVWPVLVAYFLDIEPRRAIVCAASQVEDSAHGTAASPA